MDLDVATIIPKLHSSNSALPHPDLAVSVFMELLVAHHQR